MRGMKPVDSSSSSGHGQQVGSELRRPIGWACAAKRARKVIFSNPEFLDHIESQHQLCSAGMRGNSLFPTRKGKTNVNSICNSLHPSSSSTAIPPLNQLLHQLLLQTPTTPLGKDLIRIISSFLFLRLRRNTWKQHTWERSLRKAYLCSVAPPQAAKH